MPRTFSTAIQGEIDKQFGGEPMVIVEISWSGTGFVAYSDRRLNDQDYPYPQIISVGNFDTTKIVSGGSDSQSVTVVMNDIDGSLRGIIDTQDVHLRPVRLYLSFQGLPIEEKALMFEGVINSPIQWDEAGRTFSFSVFSKLEDSEAGFTMEDGDFPFVPASESNKPWPLVFGQVCNMEAVRVSALRKGFLAQGLGVADPTIEERLCQANFLQCALLTTTETRARNSTEERFYQISLNEFLASDTMIQASFCCDGDLTFYNELKAARIKVLDDAYNVTSQKVDRQCLLKRFTEICKIIQEREQQGNYVLNPFTVRGGEAFPQDQKIKIKIGDVKFNGIMTGESFYVSSVEHPDSENIDNPDCKEINSASLGYRYGPGDDEFPTNIAECTNGGGGFKKRVVDGAGESWKYYNEFKSGSFIWLPSGTDVFLASESELVHIVSLMPGTVDQVAAYRTYGDTSLLTELDTARYTVVNSNFGGYNIVEVRLPIALSTIPDENWDDELYVSFTSSIGPNPVDSIEWLLSTYTDYTTDTASFASVKADLTNYPSNFFLKSRPSVLQLIKDIAYQSRCAIYIRDNVVFIDYLSREPSAIKTLTEDDIINNSFKFTHTTTEDLQTRHEIKWSNGEAGVYRDDRTQFDFIIKHNVPKYGIFDASYTYYTYNIFELAQKSATFWMIRNSNTWRKITFSTPVRHLDIDVFDCVQFNIAQFPNTKVIIEKSKYDADSNTVKFEAWTPILSGTSSPYFWAWPSQQAANSIFPLDGSQEESGDGYDFSVIPPLNHPLRGGYDADTAVLATDGDKHPSDLDDALPTLLCPIATGAEIADDIEPVIKILEPLAEKNFQDKLDGNEATGLNSGGGGGGSSGDEETTVCGQPGPANSGCVYEVYILYVSPRLQQNGSLPKPSCGGGPCGLGVNGSVPCTGDFTRMCHSFGSLWAATSFRASKIAEANALANCGYNYLQWAPYAIGQDPTQINPVPGSGPSGGCEDPGPTNGFGDPANAQGDTEEEKKKEIKKPSNVAGQENIAEFLQAQADLAFAQTNPGTINNPGDAI